MVWIAGFARHVGRGGMIGIGSDSIIYGIGHCCREYPAGLPLPVHRMHCYTCTAAISALIITMKRSTETPPNVPPAKTRRLSRQATVDPALCKSSVGDSKGRQLHASLFHDGTLLPHLAREHLANFQDLAPKLPPRSSLVGRVTWGSCCSGSEGDHFIMPAIEQAYNEYTASGQDRGTASGQVMHFDHLFSCEWDIHKREWIDNVVNTDRRASGQKLVCIFCDIRDMGGVTARCHAHNNQKCRIPDSDFLIVSTSCKDLSPLNNHGQTRPVLSLHTSPGGSADTWRGLLAYLDNHICKVISYENSDNVEDSSSGGGNLEVFQAELNNRDYDGQCFLLNSKLFGLPQNRRRFYAVFVLLRAGSTITGRIIDTSRRSINDMFVTLRAFVMVCQRTPPSARDVLLPCDSDAVQAELLRRMRNESTANAAGDRSWIMEHQRLYEQLRLEWGIAPRLPSTSESPWYATLTRYQQSALILHQYRIFMSQPRTASGQGRRQGQEMRLMIDLQPNANRQPNTSVMHDTSDTSDAVEIAPCILPSQLMWLNLPVERVMLGEEALMFQGWPVSNLHPKHVRQNRLQQDLAGNAVPLPVQLAVIMSSIHALSWREPAEVQAPTSSRNDVDAALALLGTLVPITALGQALADA